ncbi:MAG: GAF domain-containing protein, partial [Algicola sp.]|nr:GAF domain-containing protein [Algicola sp.]
MNLAYSVVAQASDPVYKFDNIGAEQGLGNLNVSRVLQDRQGFIWAATENGLYRYDGYDFKVFKHVPQDNKSLANSYVVSLFEDSKGTLWVGTQGGVLHKYNILHETFTRLPFDKDYPDNLVSTSDVFHIAQGKGNILWVGTFGGGVSRFDLNTDKFTHNYRHNPDDPDSLSGDNVYTVLEDYQGVLWAGTRNGGLNRFDKKTGKFKRFQHDPDNPASLGHNRVYDLFESQDGILWVGTRGGGLNRFDRKTESFYHNRYDTKDTESISSDVIYAIFEDQTGSIWVGTWGGGLNRFDRVNNRFMRYQQNLQDKYGLVTNRVTSVIQDQTGLIWIGTFGGGISKFEPDSERFGLVKHDGNNLNSLTQGKIHAIFKDKSGDVWVGTESGLNRYDESTGLFKHYRHDPNDPNSLSDNEVWAIFEDSTGVLWVGTLTGGLNQLNRQDDTFIHYRHDEQDANSLSDDYVMTIAQDDTGNLWIGTQNGLARFNRQSNNFIRYNYSPDTVVSNNNNYITSFYSAQDGALWLGTFSEGLYQYFPESSKNMHYRNAPLEPNSLSNNGIHAIYQDKKGMMWIGTNGGLNQFNPNSEIFTKFREREGLSNDLVTAVFGDENGKLWLALGEQSISLFDPTTETTINNVGSEAGCKANENGHYQASDGQLFFGSADGYCAFYPEDAFRESHPPTIAFTDFRLLNKSVSITNANQSTPLTQVINQTDSLTLTHEQNVLSFEFAALHYSDPKSNQYKYKLDGFNENWIATAANNRRATFTNLPAGQYTFRVKASNNKGVWNEQGRSIELMVLSAPWLTWWAYLIYACVLAGLVFTYVRGQRKIVHFERSLSRQLEHQVSKRTAALKKSNQSIAAISDICTQISATLDLDKLLETVYKRITELMDADVFIVGLFEPDEQRIVLKVAIEKGEYLPVSYISMDERGRAAVWCVEHEQALILNDYQKDRVDYFGDIPMPTPLGSEYVASLIYWPLIAQGQLIGVMSVQSYQKNAFKQHQQDMIQTLASTTAIALDNASAYREIELNNRNLEQKVAERTDELEQSNHSITALSEICSEISSTLDLNKLLSTVYGHIKELMDVDVFCIGLIDKERDGVVFELAIENDLSLPEIFIAMDEKDQPTIWCIDHLQPMIIGDYEKEHDDYFGCFSIPAPKIGGETDSLLYWPLIVGTKVIGVLTVQSNRKNAYNEHQQEMIQTLASTTAIALDNASAYREI